MKFLFVLSDHGFGHAARNIPIISQLLSTGNHEVSVCSSVPELFFTEKLGIGTVRFLTGKTDVGLVQRNSLDADYPATVLALESFWKEAATTVAGWLRQLGEWRPDVVIADISPLAALLAEKLEVPCVAMANFTWDEIYLDLEKGALISGVRPWIERFLLSYQASDLLLELPYSLPMSSFICSRVHLPWIGNRATKDTEFVRAALGLNPHRKYLLLSMGGHSLPEINFQTWNIPEEWEVIIAAHTLEDPQIQGIRILGRDSLARCHVNYTDLLAAMSVVLTKPGYGIVADAILNQVPVLYMARGRFAEYPLLVQALHDHLPAKEIKREELQSGYLFDSADELVKMPHLFSVENGAKRVARILENFSLYLKRA